MPIHIFLIYILSFSSPLSNIFAPLPRLDHPASRYVILIGGFLISVDWARSRTSDSGQAKTQGAARRGSSSAYLFSSYLLLLTFFSSYLLTSFLPIPLTRARRRRREQRVEAARESLPLHYSCRVHRIS